MDHCIMWDDIVQICVELRYTRIKWTHWADYSSQVTDQSCSFVFSYLPSLWSSSTQATIFPSHPGIIASSWNTWLTQRKQGFITLDINVLTFLKTLTHNPSYAELYTCLLFYCSKFRVQRLEVISKITVSSNSSLEILKCDLP